MSAPHLKLYDAASMPLPCPFTSPCGCACLWLLAFM